MTAVAVPAISPRAQRRRLLLARFLRRKVGVVCLLMITFFVIAGVFAPWIAPQSARQTDFLHVLAKPSWQHPFGTDELGRDVLSRVIWGARASMQVGLLATLLGMLIAVPLGLVAGYYGGWFDSVIARTTDLMLAFPFVILAILLAAIMGPSLTTTTIALGLAGVPRKLRITRGETLAVREAEFVPAAIASGAGDATIIFRHILPNISPTLIVAATLSVPNAIIGEAALSYIGLGLQPPAASWGGMLHSAQSYIYQAPRLAIFPGVAIVLAALAFNLLGDALRDVLDPEDGALMAEPLLEVTDLSVRFETEEGPVHAVDRLSFSLAPAEVLGVVGESGCGKSTASLSLLRLLPDTATITGRAELGGVDLLRLSKRELRRVRAHDVSYVFQEPLAALNPVLSVGSQICEVLTKNLGLSRREARDRTVELLRLVHISAPEKRLDTYPHQLSGGMRQRVVIAIALACEPKVLIADEPTTALDVTIQAGILDLLADVRDQLGTAIILITHNLGVVADIADRVMVMYAGRKAEEAPVHELFAEPQHPYTLGLLAAVPRIDESGESRTRLYEIPGRIPTLRELPEGCAFAPRCARSDGMRCIHLPELRAVRPDHWVACWHPGATA